MAGRWVAIGLVISMALNLFLIGAAAGVIALGARMARLGLTERPGVFVRASAQLPQPDRRLMRQSLRQDWDAVRADVNQSRQLRLDAWGAVGDASPDPALIKLKLAQSRQIDQSVRAQVETQVADYVLALPPDDRAIFAAGMKRALAPPTPAAPALASNAAAATH